MKYGIIFGAVVFSMILGSAGCRSGNFMNLGRNERKHDFGVPPNSIDGYAKAHGISRAEAAKRMREEIEAPRDPNASQASAEMAARTSENVHQ